MTDMERYELLFRIGDELSRFVIGDYSLAHKSLAIEAVDNRDVGSIRR